MADLGDVLRGMGSTLNPQVAQQVSAEDQQQRGVQGQIGMLMLQKKLQEASPEYQAKMQAIQNEKLFHAEVQGAKGDMTKIAGAAMAYGKPEIAMSIFNRQEDRAAKLEENKKAYELKLYDIAQRADDKRLDRESRDSLAKQADETKRLLGAITGELAKSNQALKATQFHLKADKDLQSSVRQLGGALEKANLPQMDAVLGNVEKALEDNPGVAEYISGGKAWRPDLSVPDDVKSARQAFQKLFNITLKDRSGSAVTNQELDRLKQEFATGVFKTDTQLKDAVEKARGIINAHYSGIAASYGTAALKAYNENLRNTGGKVVLEPRGATKVIDFGDLE
jgi:hypothetical protein